MFIKNNVHIYSTWLVKSKNSHSTAMGTRHNQIEDVYCTVWQLVKRDLDFVEWWRKPGDACTYGNHSEMMYNEIKNQH